MEPNVRRISVANVSGAMNSGVGAMTGRQRDRGHGLTQDWSLRDVLREQARYCADDWHSHVMDLAADSSRIES